MAIDPLSETAHRILKIDASHAYEALVAGREGNAEAGTLLQAMDARNLLAGGVANPDDAELLRGALYLWHDHLEAAHRIFQADSRPAGSFWHAILHRHEGDFSNSKYWYARCADHPAMAMIAAQANPVLNPLPVDKSILKLTIGGWNPNAFVDLVEEIAHSPNDPRRKIVVALQKLEWRVLFDQTARSTSEENPQALDSP